MDTLDYIPLQNAAKALPGLRIPLKPATHST